MASWKKSVFAPYKVISEYEDRPHPAEIVETMSLASVSVPRPVHQHALPKEILKRKSGSLSGVQMDAVLMAGEAHQEFLDGQRNKRQAFLIGDGTGVGKGRELAAVIANNWYQGRKKAVWISCSQILIEDARRDMRDLLKPLKDNAPDISLFSTPGNYNRIEAKSGVLFSTYATLGRGKKQKTSCGASTTDSSFLTRQDQILDWLGGKKFKGVVIFDEAHKAKGYAEDGKFSSKVGNAVVSLQDKLPKARIVYVSATIAACVRDMEFMCRLGLWGTPYTAFDCAQSFFNFVEGRGMAGYEIAACEMKSRGMYISRHLSYRNCNFEMKKARSDPKMHILYNQCSEMWTEIIKMCPGKKRSLMWATCQKFFRALCISAKLPQLLIEVRNARSRNQSVVIGLQSTNEAAYNVFRVSDYHNQEDLFSPCRTYLESLLLNQFGFGPVQLGLTYKREQSASSNAIVLGGVRKLYPPSKKARNDDPTSESDSDSDNSSDGETDNMDTDGSDGLSIFESDMEEKPSKPKDKTTESREKIARIFKEVADELPLNPLDIICSEFGYGNVSEMTGRRAFQIILKKKGIFTPNGEVVRKVENSESPLKLAHFGFQNGNTRIAVISEAASTGISLHASRKCKNQDQRFHIILETPWSAMSTCQQIGRTNRSNQVIPPYYLVLMSDVPGETRFATSIAGRMGSLGALCKGDRNSSHGQLWDEYDMSASIAKLAIKELLNTVAGNRTSLQFFIGTESEKERMQLFKALYKIRAIKRTKTGFKPVSAVLSHEKFTNRLLSMKIGMQKRLLSFLDAATDRFKDRNENDTQIKINDLTDEIQCPFTEIESVEYEINSKVRSQLVTFQKDDIFSWKNLDAYLQDKKYNFYEKQFLPGLSKVCVGIQEVGTSQMLKIIRPSSASSIKKSFGQLKRKGYKIVSATAAKEIWTKCEDAFRFEKCSGYIKRGQVCKGECEHKQPGVKFAVVIGGFLSVWDNIDSILQETKFVRHYKEEKQLLGIYIPSGSIENANRIMSELTRIKK